MPDSTTLANGFHESERIVQRRAGVSDSWSAAASTAIRSFMPGQHRELFQQLPFVVAGAVDDRGQPWATIFEGEPGFITTPDATHLRIAAALPEVDPLISLLEPATKIGLLGIQPHTRRRNRANGTVSNATNAATVVHVTQSFGNCPKYIQARTARYVSGVALSPRARKMSVLDRETREIIGAADTFFIASSYSARRGNDSAAHGIDVSHRGGRPGFVRIEGNMLSVPDFVGNNYFNTLGNLEAHPYAGLLFVDFSAGTWVHIAVRSELEWLSSVPNDRISTHRLLHFHIQEIVYVTDRSALEWGVPVLSPFLATR